MICDLQKDTIHDITDFMMMSDAQIIDELGGPTKVSQRLPVGRQAISNWKVKGIADRFRPGIYEMAERAGFAERINKESFFGFWPDTESTTADLEAAE